MRMAVWQSRRSIEFSRFPKMPDSARFGRFVSTRAAQLRLTSCVTVAAKLHLPLYSCGTNPPRPHWRKANRQADEDLRAIIARRRGASSSLLVSHAAAIIENCVAKYRIDSLAALARQLQFTPSEVRAQQLASAEELLASIEATKAYPL